jgi:DHA1 family tetracycline resistance protein-like MFS transporter
VTTALPYYAKDFGADAGTLGLLVGSWAAAQFICAPLWGRLSDRIGRRPVMLVTIAGTCASLAMLGMATTLWGLFATRVLAGAFAANISVASAYIADVTDDDERTRWMGVLGMSFGIGFLLGPALGGALGPLGYAAPMLASAGLAVINLVFAAVFLVEPPSRVPAASADSPLGGAAGAAAPETRMAVLRDPVIRRMCLANFGFSLAVTQLETMFAFFMMDRFDFDLPHVAMILVAMAVVMGAIQGGGMKALAARFPERGLIGVGSLTMAVAFVAVPYAPTVALLMIPLFLSAIGRAIVQAPLMGLVSMQATSKNRGVVMGAFQSAAAFARIGGPIIAGWLYLSDQPMPFLLAAALLAAVAMLARGLPSRAKATPMPVVSPSAASGSG